MSKEEEISNIPKIDKSNFIFDEDALLPGFTLDDLSPKDKYLVIQQNKQLKILDTLSKVAIDSNLHQRRTNGKVIRLQEFQHSIEPTIDKLEKMTEIVDELNKWKLIHISFWKIVAKIFIISAAIGGTAAGVISIISFLNN